MKPIDEMIYHPLSERLVNIIQTKTQNTNPLFFRVVIAFYLTLITSHMRVSIKGWAGRGTIPINMYALASSLSGSGKGLSTSLIETEVINTFKEAFLNHTFPISAEHNCEQLAIKRANKHGTDSNDELIKIAKEFQSLGSMVFIFSEATAPAIKQMRQKLLMAKAGSCNLIIDEIASNLHSSIEALTLYLELFDKGLAKEKLTKSTSDNIRIEKLDGYTPANLLMFGTPTKLLDGGKTEDQLIELLDIGYARRCFFAFSDKTTKNTDLSVDAVIAQLFNDDNDDYLEELSDTLGLLADLANVNKTLTIEQDAIRLLVEYKLHCEKLSLQLAELETIKKSELEHRYFKVLKLAGAYSFIDGLNSIDTKHIEYAIKLAEDSGKAFNELLTPQRAYIKLAKYLASVKSEVTLADLDADLPCFKGSKSAKDEMIQLATAWGYKNNIIIKKSYMESILFLHADSIEETNPDKLIVSYTLNNDMTTDYINDYISFDTLPKVFTHANLHWLNHHLENAYRKEENVITGFNLLVLDVDNSVSLSTARLLLKQYKYIIYTTKRHTEKDNRFRIVLPLNYTLKLDSKDFKEFYNNVLNNLPFTVDNQCGQRAKKWLANTQAEVYMQEGELFDVLPYIPKTSKNEQREKLLQSQSEMDNLERWIINNTCDGNRNNMLLRYACILIDAGFNFETIKDKTKSLNNKLVDKLDELEIESTIFHTVAGKLGHLGRL